jgi:hypothetical protein
MNSSDYPVASSAVVRSIETIKANTPTQHVWADEMFQVLKRYIQEFEDSLDAEHEVGMMMTNLGQSVLMTVSQVTYEAPTLMVFRGRVNGFEATLIQHISQLNFLLMSVDKEPDLPKRQIGFATTDGE